LFAVNNPVQGNQWVGHNMHPRPHNSGVARSQELGNDHDLLGVTDTAKLGNEVDKAFGD
jgi:hypothetical protein